MGYDSVVGDYYGPMGWMDKRRKRSIWWPCRFIGGADSKSILDV